MKRLFLLAAVMACASCASDRKPAAAPRASGLLACAPAEADVVVVADVARLMGSETVRPLLELLHGPTGVALADVDIGVAAVVRMGEADEAWVVWLRGPALDARARAKTIEQSAAIDDHTLVVGPDALRRCGGGPSAELLALLDAAAPADAQGTSVRVAAKLPARARERLAAQAELSAAPELVSIWMDAATEIDVSTVVDAGAAELGQRLGKLGVGLVSVEGPRVRWNVDPLALRRWIGGGVTP